MEGECPGVAHFNKIKDSIVIDPNAVYTIFGHGCDLEDELLILPENTNYITATACGLTTGSNGPTRDLGKDFLNNTLIKPITNETLNKYEMVQRLIHDDVSINKEYIIHTHSHNNKFTNNKNWCFLWFNKPAGLRKLGHITQSIPELREELPQIYTMRSYFLMHFEGSLFPTCDQVNKMLNTYFTQPELNNYNYYFNMFTSELDAEADDDNIHSLDYSSRFIDMIKNNFSIDFATLIYNLKGTFINNACRPICNGPDTKEDPRGLNKFVKLSRANSGRITYQLSKKDLDTFEKTPGFGVELSQDAKQKLKQLPTI